MTVEVGRDGAVGIITLNDPDRRNALDAAKAQRIAEAVRGFSGLPKVVGSPAGEAGEPVRAILLRAQGPAFCAGADLAGGVYATEFFESLTQMLQAITDSPLPVIADVQGPAVGAGCQLLLACDLRVFGEKAAIWVPAAEHGFALDAWTHERLKEMLGGAVARNVMIGAAKVGSEQAVALGFAVKIGDDATALDYAHSMAALSPLSMEHSKRVLNSPDPSQDESLEKLFYAAWASEDVKEARAARKERRAPKFTGR